MSKPRLLIVNSSPEFCRIITTSMRDFADIQCCYTGRQALNILQTQAYELLLLDLSLPELDGLTLLKTTQAAGIFPATLVMMDLPSNYVNSALGQLKISYAMRKPCQTDAVVSNLLDIAAALLGDFSVPVPADPVSELLLKLHFNPNHGGYEYFRRGIPLFAANPEQFLTKELYASIGKPLGKSWSQVERSMRTAIEKAWELDESGIWQRYFPGMVAKPANKVFLTAAIGLLFPAESCKVG